jgi:hypothetical protein
MLIAFGVAVDAIANMYRYIFLMTENIDMVRK